MSSRQAKSAGFRSSVGVTCPGYACMNVVVTVTVMYCPSVSQHSRDENLLHCTPLLEVQPPPTTRRRRRASFHAGARTFIVANSCLGSSQKIPSSRIVSRRADMSINRALAQKGGRRGGAASNMAPESARVCWFGRLGCLSSHVASADCWFWVSPRGKNVAAFCGKLCPATTVSIALERAAFFTATSRAFQKHTRFTHNDKFLFQSRF